jgi:hypothetical protein
MSVHLTPADARAMRSRASSPDELARAAAHVGECAECRALLRDDAPFDELVDAFVAGAEEWHVEPETMIAYVDGSLDPIDRELVDSHLADCMHCRREVRDLDAFRRSMRPQRRNAMLWAAAAAIVVVLLGYPLVHRSAAPAGHTDAAAVTLFDGGRKIAVMSDGRVLGLSLAGDAQSRIAAALTRGTLSEPARAATLRRETESLRGAAASGSFAPVAPVGCVIVTPQPTFEWTAVPGARYKVEIFGDQFRPVAQSEVLDTNSWTVPQQLGHGETYAWQVTAYKTNGETTTSPAPPSPEARFAVIDSQDAAKIDRLQQMQPRSHLALGIAYAEAGAAVEAERELAALNAENGGAEATARLLRNLRARR